jgi:hypothetical protein
MKYLLDMNVCVDYLNGRYPSVTFVTQRFGGDESLFA